MYELIRDNGESIYFAAFLIGMGGVALWEGVAPRRVLRASLRRRWVGNFAMYVLAYLMLRLLFPGLLIGVAAFASDRDWGILNLVVVPSWVEILATVMLLDFGRYALHRAFHTVPILWRIHGMHHSDADYDFTTGIRFHPLEAFLLFCATSSIIAGLGAPVAAVLISETLLALSGPFVHGNIRFWSSLDFAMRSILVTPDMHRVHHSIIEKESFSNFSSIFSWWDRIFGTYVAQPADGHAGMRIGLAGFEEPRHLEIGWMLVHPFLPRNKPALHRPPAGQPGK